MNIKQNIDVFLNLFDKNFDKKIKKVTTDLNKNLRQVQSRAKHFGMSVDTLRQTQKMFGLEAGKSSKQLRTMNGHMLGSTNRLNSYIGKQAKFGNVMGMSIDQLQNFNKSGAQFNNIGAKFANKTRLMTHGMKGFKMEMLGVMFFGMSLMRVFSSLTKKSFEWLGVTEIFSTALGMLFLPLAEKFLGWALRFLDWVDNLSPKQKETIGNIVLIVGALGSLLFILGTVVLGVGSVVMAFGKIFGIAKPLAAFGEFIAAIFGGLTLPILAVIAIIVAVVAGMVIAWKENFMGMKDVVSSFIDGIKLAFKSIIGIVSGVFTMLRGLFNGNFDLFREGFVKFIKSIGNLLIGLANLIINGVLAIVIGVVRGIIGIVQTAINGIIWVANKVSKLFGGDGAIGEVNWVDSLKNVDLGGVNIPHFKTGGLMQEDGLAYLHKGERVSTESQVNRSPSVSSPNITINAAISNDYDVRKLADQLNRYWIADFNKMNKSK